MRTMKSHIWWTIGGVGLAVAIAFGGNAALPEDAKTAASSSEFHAMMSTPLQGIKLLAGVAITAAAVWMVLNVDRADQRREMHGCLFGAIQIGLLLAAALVIYVIAGGTL